jgi:uncharacterized protein YndB with AHSA1/START domain
MGSNGRTIGRGEVRMTVAFEVSVLIPAPPETVYRSWLDSDQHAAMTGASARVSDRVGASFEAWDGYIQGRNLALTAHSRILQAWRTTEFASDEDDSLLEIQFEPADSGTLITLRHTNLPAHGMQYKQGWLESYFEPMAEFFATGVDEVEG